MNEGVLNSINMKLDTIIRLLQELVKKDDPEPPAKEKSKGKVTARVLKL